MTPKEVLREWIDCFNAADASRIVELYADDAVNHQVANEPIAGKAALYEMFANEFATAEISSKTESGPYWNGKILSDFADAVFSM